MYIVPPHRHAYTTSYLHSRFPKLTASSLHRHAYIQRTLHQHAYTAGFLSAQPPPCTAMLAQPVSQAHCLLLAPPCIHAAYHCTSMLTQLISCGCTNLLPAPACLHSRFPECTTSCVHRHFTDRLTHGLPLHQHAYTACLLWLYQPPPCTSMHTQPVS
jgi:hypothetical protein